MRNLFLTAVALALASCSSCDDKKESPAPSEPAVASPTPTPAPTPGPQFREQANRQVDPNNPMSRFEPRRVTVNGKTLILKPTRPFMRMNPNQLRGTPANEPPPAPAGDGPAPAPAPAPQGAPAPTP